MNKSKLSRNKSYYERHKIRCRAVTRAYYRANRDEICRKRRQERIDDPEGVRAAERLYDRKRYRKKTGGVVKQSVTAADRILLALEKAPAAGFTSQELAGEIGKTLSSISASAHRMWLNGKLERVRKGRKFVWQKPKKPQRSQNQIEHELGS